LPHCAKAALENKYRIRSVVTKNGILPKLLRIANKLARWDSQGSSSVREAISDILRCILVFCGEFKLDLTATLPRFDHLVHEAALLCSSGANSLQISIGLWPESKKSVSNDIQALLKKLRLHIREVEEARGMGDCDLTEE